MEWLEADPLPVECQDFQEEDCYNCDHAGKRWYLSQEDDLRIRRKGLLKAIERLQRQVDAIDRQLLFYNTQDSAMCKEDNSTHYQK